MFLKVQTFFQNLKTLQIKKLTLNVHKRKDTYLDFSCKKCPIWSLTEYELRAEDDKFVADLNGLLDGLCDTLVVCEILFEKRSNGELIINLEKMIHLKQLQLFKCSLQTLPKGYANLKQLSTLIF